jgi:hypothetical protein
MHHKLTPGCMISPLSGVYLFNRGAHTTLGQGRRSKREAREMDGRRVRNTSHLVLQRPGVGEVLNNFACSDPDPLL